MFSLRILAYEKNILHQSETFICSILVILITETVSYHRSVCIWVSFIIWLFILFYTTIRFIIVKSFYYL